jgi:hypothetical protein
MSEIKSTVDLLSMLGFMVQKEEVMTQESMNKIMYYCLSREKEFVNEQDKHLKQIGILLKKLADYENKQRL